MKKFSTLLMAIILVAISTNTFAQVSGNVFRDYNGDGVKTVAVPTDPGIEGITVKAFSAMEALLGTVVTDANGNYSFTAGQVPSGTAVRIEFTAPATSTNLFPSTKGLAHGSNVQFVTAPSTTLSTGFNAPKDYVASNNVQLIIPQHWGQTGPTSGPNAGQPASAQTSVSVFNEGDVNYAPADVELATIAEVGNVWGVAHHKESKNVFVSSFFRRYAPLGPNGPGAIYKISAGPDGIFGNADDASLSPTLFINLDTYFGAGSAGGVLATANDSINAMGKYSFGDIELSADGTKLYVVNLFDRKIYTIPLNAAGTAPALGTITASPVIPAGSCTGTARPFGLAVRNDDGKVFVSYACDRALSTDATVSVIGFNSTTNTWDAAPIIDYTASTAGGFTSFPCCFAPWTLGSTYEVQLMAMGLDIDPSGKFINLTAVSRKVFAVETANTRNTGYMFRFCYNGSTWQVENAGVSCGLTGISTTNGRGPGGGQFYPSVAVDGNTNVIQGAALQIPGRPYFTYTKDDPLATFEAGVTHASNTNGAVDHDYLIKYGDYAYLNFGTPEMINGKLNPLGDLEYVTAPNPIEIGNRIWRDTNGDGIQNAGETGISGVTLELFNPGTSTVVGEVTTDANGNWYFSSATGTSGAGATYGLAIAPNTNYVVRVKTGAGFDWNGGVGTGDLAGLLLTTTDVVGIGAADASDNDASLVLTVPQVSVTTGAAGQNNFNIDFGFKGTQSLGNKVWMDMGAGGGTAKNGIQDGLEPGVSSVPVDLYTTGVDGLAGTADDVLVASTLTDAYGMYLFKNLDANVGYFVKVTPGANYNFTTQTNTTDNNNTTGIDVTGSDVNVLGTSYIVILSPGENNLNIDAGLIFNTPAAGANTNSIGDKVWFDANANGVNDGGAAEPGVAGVTVTLYNAAGDVVAITKTDAAGMYLFSGLPANTNYSVGFSAPGGTVLTSGGVLDIANGSTNSDPSPATGRTTVFSSGAAGTAITGVDAGLRNDINGSIGDFVWNDLNKDGIQDAGEPGIPGVTMTLYRAGANGVVGGGDDVLIGTTTTDANGYYIFPNLALTAGSPSGYFVVATPVAGYTRTLADVTALNPGLDAKDSDFGVNAAYPGSFVSAVRGLLSSATRDMTIDLGMYNSTLNLNSLGDKVWNDVNDNGLLDGAEAGIGNITVRLLNNLGAPVNNPATGKPYVVVTDATGMYKFVDLPDGLYTVEFANLPAGFLFSTKDAAGTGAPGSPTDGTTDSDVDPSTGRTAVIDLGSASPTSVNLTNVDAGIVQGTPAGTASIGNKVWYDLNNNGIQDGTELGVGKVQVTLLNGAGAVVNVPGTSTPYVIFTNALGEYLFTNLPAGDYQVRFGNFPVGYTSSAANAGTDDLKDADANFAGTSTLATTATTVTYSLKTGEDNLSVDMGIVPAAGTNALGNFVWNDTNGNGRQDAGEPGVQGVTVTLYNNAGVAIAVTTTDKNGAYAFVGLPDGTYTVGFSNIPDGFVLAPKNAGGSTPANDSDADAATGRTSPIVLVGGVTNNDVDAGLQGTRAALGNYVWLDTNGDGKQDATEKPVSGVTVTLYAADGVTPVASAITDATGNYFFGNLAPATYVVGFSTVPGAVAFTQQITPGDNGDNTNSDANPATGLTSQIVLGTSETDLTVDAGLRPNNPASVGDLVWNDLDNDGVKDADEPGLPGIIVTLVNAGGTVVGTAVTDGNGNYLISNVPPANGYFIRFSNLPLASPTVIYTTQTSNVSPTDATNGSDPNPAGQTAPFNLAAGQYLPHVDAGVQNVKPLPVKLISFTALPNGNKVNVEWIVGDQVNVESYEVEYSIDGRSFSKIDIAAVSSASRYTTLHGSPAAGVNFYRLRIIGKDGEISFSDIRKVNFGKGGTVLVFPNPASNVVNITLTGNMVNKAAIVSLLSIDGKVINTTKIAVTGQTESFNVSNLANGTYIVRIATNDTVSNTTIEIIK
jgi:hypothetical protein